jgi:hypothetical protein
MIKNTFKNIINYLGYQLIRYDQKVDLNKLLDPVGVELLADSDFQASCKEVRDLTLLDIVRLANLWQFCKMSNPIGSIIEVGSYRGGGALHLSNCCPDRKIVICDSFEGFNKLDSKLDSNFSMTMFKNTTRQQVEELFHSRQRNYEIVQGFFPYSCEGRDIGYFSFVHLDVDTYKSTKEALSYLNNLMLERSFIVLDDYFRKAEGVNLAISEFLQENPQTWLCLPLFPSQALLVHQSWYYKK